MSSRFASFRGPSTPTSSPVQARQPSSALGSPHGAARQVESTYHRKLRSAMQDLRTCARTWDDLVMHDGRRAAVALVDSRTELDNSLATLPEGTHPRTRIVGPKIADMEERLVDLDTVIVKLRKQFHRMNSIVDGLETLLFEALKTKGYKWAHEEPLWTTWSLEKFVTSISSILVPYHRSLDAHAKMIAKLRPHSTSFEVSKNIISEWVTQASLEEGGWDAAWEDLCEAEIERWNQSK